MKCRAYYFSLKDFETDYSYSLSPFSSTKFSDFVSYVLGTLTYPPFTLNDSNVEKMWQLLAEEKHNDPIFKIVKCFDDTTIPMTRDQDVIDMFEDWVAKLVAIIAKTYPYYNAVLTAYAGAEATLMADVKATSWNKVRFNDTPQNAGSGGTYEGEDYMTHFTRTDGESSTPLTTKINRLREIQDQYKRTMADWLKEVGRVFLPEGD